MAFYFFHYLCIRYETRTASSHHLSGFKRNDQQKQHLEAARQQLALLLSDLHFTTEHWTDPVHNLHPAQYLNQLCEGTTTFSANLLEEVLKEIEKRLGRTKNEDGIVAIDLDLMLYDDERHHLRDWERHYIKDLLGELSSFSHHI